MKILIIEDDPKIASFVQKGLQEEGFIVDTAQDGADGLYLCEQGNYDLFIIDWMLPSLDGTKICERLRDKKGGNSYNKKSQKVIELPRGFVMTIC